MSNRSQVTKFGRCPYWHFEHSTEHLTYKGTWNIDIPNVLLNASKINEYIGVLNILLNASKINEYTGIPIILLNTLQINEYTGISNIGIWNIRL